MRWIRSIAKALFLRCFENQKDFVAFCRHVVNRNDGDENYDMEDNGEFRLLRQALPDAKTVFDVGANVGRWTIEALRVNPKCQIHCFEPCKDTFDKLSSLELPNNVVLSKCALGEADAEMTLFIDDENCGGNSLHDRRGGFRPMAGQETVTTTTMDGYCEKRGIERIDFAKIDVEGHEAAVLRGARKLLSQGRIGIIQIEYNNTWVDAGVLLRDVWDFMGQTNPEYSFHKILPSGLRSEEAYSKDFETYRQSNWAIIHPSARLK